MLLITKNAEINTSTMVQWSQYPAKVRVITYLFDIQRNKDYFIHQSLVHIQYLFLISFITQIIYRILFPHIVAAAATILF